MPSGPRADWDIPFDWRDEFAFIRKFTRGLQETKVVNAEIKEKYQLDEVE